MKYKSPGAFRQALEEKLRQQSLASHTPLVRLRKMVAFDRFLARIVRKDPTIWIIKGGLALQLRLGERARTTRDIDASLDREWTKDEITEQLRRASSTALRDWFDFEVSEPVPAATGAPAGGFRYPIRCLLDGRNFERFHLDVGLGDAISGEADLITGPDILEFAEISPAQVPCCPLETQLAEKLHAYTRSYASGGTTRVRDLVDILLIATLGPLGSRQLFHAIQATFAVRSTHPFPSKLPEPATDLSAPFFKWSRELKLSWSTLRDGFRAAELFLNPVLSSKALAQWDPVHWKWN